MSTSRAPPKGDQFNAAGAGDAERLNLSLRHAAAAPDADAQGVSVLHVACLHGRLACVKLLVESGLVDVNGGCGRGRRPVHMVLWPPGSPGSAECLEYLLDRGADVNVSTASAVTPLHLAAAGGLLACTEMLVHAGADVHARDSHGHTPLDMARSGCHRALARYLKDCMWKADKERELQMRRQVRVLYRDLVLMSKLDDCREKARRRALAENKMEEWAGGKGLPPLQAAPASGGTASRFHGRCLLSERRGGRTGPRDRARPGEPRQPWNRSTNPSRPAPAPPAPACDPPWAVRAGPGPARNPSPEPDLRGSVTLSKGAGGRHWYSTRWASSPCRAPDLPLDALERGLFPKAFPGRTGPAVQGSGPRSVLDLPRRGGPQGQAGASPWTEVALHLPEVLEPGHY